MTGCSSAQKGAASGGVVGAIVGASVGQATAAAPLTGAWIGGLGGATVGGATGDIFDQMSDADRAREMENLRAELDSRNAEIAALRAGGAGGADPAELAAAQNRISELETTIAGLNNALDGANAELENGQASRLELQNELEALRAQVAEAESRNRINEAEIARLTAEVESLRNQLEAKEATVADLGGKLEILQTSLQGKAQQLAELEGELNELNVQLEETSRGLTLTIAESLLYEPGMAELTTEGKALLGNVARILKDRFPRNEFLIEGHTDNQPIVRSGWRSNWELGAARALTMVHELIDQHGINPGRVSATSYGEFRPSSTNATPEGRRLNRRAVIVVLPEQLPLQRQHLALAK
jgi:chemotaxis protein MotB